MRPAIQPNYQPHNCYLKISFSYLIIGKKVLCKVQKYSSSRPMCTATRFQYVENHFNSTANSTSTLHPTSLPSQLLLLRLSTGVSSSQILSSTPSCLTNTLKPHYEVRIPEKDSIYFFNFTSSSLSLRCLLPRFSFSFSSIAQPNSNS